MTIINIKRKQIISNMTKKEGELLVEKILEQQETINKLHEKISFLHVLIDSISKELEQARQGGKV